MPRSVRAMTAAEVEQITRPGRHAVGGVSGLSLKINKKGHRSWVLRTAVDGKRREFGLGAVPSITLNQARQRARIKLDQIFRQEHEK